MIKYLSKILIPIMVVSIGCVGPLDIDTPRNKIVPKPIDSTELSLVSISVEANGNAEHFDIYDLEPTIVQIDTLSKTPLVWGSLIIKSTNVTNFDKKILQISRIQLNIDNLSAVGEPVLLKSNSAKSSIGSFLISRGISGMYDTTLYADPSRNKTTISFSHNKEEKVLWLYLDAKVYEKRLSLIKDSVEIIQSIPDSLIIKCRLQFNY